MNPLTPHLLLITAALTAATTADLIIPVTVCHDSQGCQVCPDHHTLSNDSESKQTCLPCREDATAYFGNNILSEPVTVDSEAACAKACFVNAQCQLWTYQIASGNCYLKRDRPEKHESRGFVSGVKNCTVTRIQPLTRTTTPLRHLFPMAPPSFWTGRVPH